MTLTPIFSNFETTNVKQNKMAKYKCINFSEGCPVEGNRENITTKHQFRCKFRKVSCPYFDCGLSIKFREVLHHLAKDHEVTSYSKLPILDKSLTNFTEFKFQRNHNVRQVSLYDEDYKIILPFKSDGKKFLLQSIWNADDKHGEKLKFFSDIFASHC